MKYILPIIFLLLGVSLAEAQLEINVEKRVRLEAPAGYQVYVWNWPPALVAEQRGNILLIDGPKGDYRVNLVALNATVVDQQVVFDQQSGFIDVSLGGGDPEPDPVDPDDPPTPPSDAPFDAPGLTVVVVYEYQDAGKLPPDQRAILGSGELIAWLSNATDGRSGFWDDDSEWHDTAREYMKDGFEVAKKAGNGKPWVAISNGKTGTVVPLPESIDAFKTLVQRYQ